MDDEVLNKLWKHIDDLEHQLIVETANFDAIRAKYTKKTDRVHKQISETYRQIAEILRSY